MSLVTLRSRLQLMDFQQDFILKSDFSRRHLYQNPPALAGGSLNSGISETSK